MSIAVDETLALMLFLGLVVKDSDGVYTLTEKGRRYKRARK